MGAKELIGFRHTEFEGLVDLCGIHMQMSKTKIEYSGDTMVYWLGMKALKLRDELKSQLQHLLGDLDLAL